MFQLRYNDIFLNKIKEVSNINASFFFMLNIKLYAFFVIDIEKLQKYIYDLIVSIILFKYI